MNMSTRNDTNSNERTPVGAADFFSVTDLAHLSRESPHVWMKRIRLGQIAHVRFGRNVRVAQRDFETFVASRRVVAR